MSKKDNEEKKYGVEHFAKAAGVEPASARVTLRKHGIKKAGKSYGWDSMKEVQAAVDKCQSGKAKAKKAAPAKKSKKAVKKKAPTKRKSNDEGDSASAE